MGTEDSFLGRGWAFPPTFTAGGGEVGMVAGAEDVAESLRILLATRPGERVMQERYGCDLDRVLFEEIDHALINALTRLVRDAIVDYEPRIALDRLEVNESEPGRLLLSIDYTIRSTNSRYNMVYPFYLRDATAPGV